MGHPKCHCSHVKRKSLRHHELGLLEFGFALLSAMSSPRQLLVIHHTRGTAADVHEDP